MARTTALIKGLVFGPDGPAFSPHTRAEGGKTLSSLFEQSVLKIGKGACRIGRTPVDDLEAAVINQLRAVFLQPEIVAGNVEGDAGA